MLAIVTDSSVNLTRDEARRLGVEVVPMTFMADGVARAEGFLGENSEGAALVRDGRVTGTHGATAAAFEPVFRALTAQGDDVLCITLSSKLSGTYRRACDAADAVRSDLRRAAGATSREANSAAAARTAGLPRIAVLDSQTGISGMEFLVRMARRLADAGCGFDELYDRLGQRRARQAMRFSAVSIEALRASGCMAMVPQSVSPLLNRFPVLGIRDGAVQHVSTARGTSALVREMLPAEPVAVRDVVITHFGARGALCAELFAAAKTAFPSVPVRVKEGGPVLSYILGSGAISVAWDVADEE